MEREGNKMKSTRREMEKKSEIGSAIEELSTMTIVKPGENHGSAHIPTKPFLSVCYFVLQVLGEFIDFSLDLFNCCSNVMNVNVLGHLKHCCYASNR